MTEIPLFLEQEIKIFPYRKLWFQLKMDKHGLNKLNCLLSAGV